MTIHPRKLKERGRRRRLWGLPPPIAVPKIRIVRVDAEPVGDSLDALAEAVQALQEAIQGFKTENEGSGIGDEIRRLETALKASKFPEPRTNAIGAFDKMRRGFRVEDIYPAFRSFRLIESSLRIRRIGYFMLSRGLGEGLRLVEVTLRIEPFPPPVVTASLSIARESESDAETRERKAKALT